MTLAVKFHNPTTDPTSKCLAPSQGTKSLLWVILLASAWQRPLHLTLKTKKEGTCLVSFKLAAW